MIPFLRHFLLFCLLIFFAPLLQGQSLYDLSRPASSLVQSGLRGDVVYFYETTHLIKEHTGSWNFRLGQLEEASVQLFQEDGQYEQVIVYKDFIDKLRIFSILQFEYGKKNRLQTVAENHAMISRNNQYEYRYDKRGKPTSMTLQSNGVPYAETTYTTGNKRQLTENMQVLNSKIRAVFERTGQAVQTYEFFDTSGLALYQHHYTYKDDGRLSKIALTSNHPKFVNDLITLEYLDDEHGNWIKILEHHHAAGRYKLVQRQLVYRDQLPDPAIASSPVGQWNCPTHNYVLKTETDGTFSLIDLNKRQVTVGSWKNEGWGRYNFHARSKGYFSQHEPFDNENSLTVELRPGRLIMYNDEGDHYDFMAESVNPTDELGLTMQKYMRWEAQQWESPGKRAEDAIPADIRAAFDQAIAIAPGRFKVCIDDLCGVVDETGRVLIPFAYTNIDIALPEVYATRENGKAGLIDLQGQEILPAIYDRIWLEPSLGFSVFGVRSPEGRYYYELDTGEFWPYEKESLREFNDTRWVVRTERWSLLCDRAFQPIVPEGRYYNIKILSPDRYLALGPNRTYEIIDANGQVVKKLPGYRRIITRVFGYLEAETTAGDLYALLDYEGHALTEPIYENLSFGGESRKPGDLAWELEIRNVVAKFKKPNGEEGYLTGLGEEVEVAR